MNTEIIVAIIALLGTVCGSFGGILISSKLTNYRIEQLEKRVDEHNHLKDRMISMEEQMKSAKHRIDDLEKTTEHLKVK